MKIWLTRHGQTQLNKDGLMQGLTDEPLNELGVAQAESMNVLLHGVRFDRVYSSPLKRAVKTASIVAGISEDEIIKDDRIVEVNFGDYELKPYKHLGLKMSAFWLLPELVPAPKSVETIKEMAERSSAFMKDVEKEGGENILIVCHGGIIRALVGYLEGRKNGIKWRPRPLNCEVRVYEYRNGKYHFVESKLPENEEKKTLT